MDANGCSFEFFHKGLTTEMECGDYCTREPKCAGYHHSTIGNGYCTVQGPGLALSLADWTKHDGNGGVWPIAKAGSGATCSRKIATTAGNNRFRVRLPQPMAFR